MHKSIYKNAINNIICITHKYPNEITKLNQIEKAQGIMLSCLAWFSRTQQRTSVGTTGSFYDISFTTMHECDVYIRMMS